MAGLTTDEIAKAGHHLSTTRDQLVDLVTGLSPSQWCFKPTSDRWSIVEILEHLALLEGRVYNVIVSMADAPMAESVADLSQADDQILAEIPKRSKKVKAPEPVCPAGRWSGPEALQCFLAAREQTIGLLHAENLRGRVRRHPIFGAWDGYQWLLATGAHTARHIGQIREIKADPNYPVQSQQRAFAQTNAK